MAMARDEPDRLYIRKKDRDDYAMILGPGSPLQGQEAKVAFIMAMLIGYTEGKEQDLGPQKDGYFRTEYLTDSEKTVIKSIAVEKSGNLKVLQDPKEVYALAEKFAAGGLESLKNQLFSGEHGSFEKRLELLLRSKLDSIRNG